VNNKLSWVILVSMILTGCLSLADDITPPPDSGEPSSLGGTSVPTIEPTRETSPSSESLSEDEAGDGLVNVFVLDQTEGLLLENDPEVRLEGYDQFELAFEAALPVTTDGFVQFTDIPFPEGRVYFASVSYGGAVYRSQIVLVEGDTAGLELQVEIYPTTTDQSGLIIDRVHVLVEFNRPDTVDVVEIFVLSNFGDATIVPESPGEISVEFPLPAEALGIGFEDGSLGQRYLSTEDGFGDTVSIPPGSGIYPVSVYYSLPYEKNQLEFRQRFNYPVGAIVVMLPAGEVIVQGGNLEDLGVQSIPSGEVAVYSASSFQADDILEFRITGKPAIDMPDATSSSDPGSGSINVNDMIIYGAGGIGAILLVGGVWLLIRNRQRDNLDPEQDVQVDFREKILDSIIALDDLFANGEIDENAYLQKRKELKKELKLISED